MNKEPPEGRPREVLLGNVDLAEYALYEDYAGPKFQMNMLDIHPQTAKAVASKDKLSAPVMQKILRIKTM